MCTMASGSGSAWLPDPSLSDASLVRGASIRGLHARGSDWLFCWGDPGVVRGWDTAAAASRCVYESKDSPMILPEIGPTTGVHFIPGANRLFSTTREGVVRCVDIDTNDQTILRPCASPLTSLAAAAAKQAGIRDVSILAGWDELMVCGATRFVADVRPAPLDPRSRSRFSGTGPGRRRRQSRKKPSLPLPRAANDELFRNFTTVQGKRPATHGMHIWDLSRGKVVQILGMGSKTPYVAAQRVGTAPSLFAAATGAGAVCLWDLRTPASSGGSSGGSSSSGGSLFAKATDICARDPCMVLREPGLEETMSASHGRDRVAVSDLAFDGTSGAGILYAATSHVVHEDEDEDVEEFGRGGSASLQPMHRRGRRQQQQQQQQQQQGFSQRPGSAPASRSRDRRNRRWNTGHHNGGDDDKDANRGEDIRADPRGRQSPFGRASPSAIGRQSALGVRRNRLDDDFVLLAAWEMRMGLCLRTLRRSAISDRLTHVALEKSDVRPEEEAYIRDEKEEWEDKEDSIEEDRIGKTTGSRALKPVRLGKGRVFGAKRVLERAARMGSGSLDLPRLHRIECTRIVLDPLNGIRALIVGGPELHERGQASLRSVHMVSGETLALLAAPPQRPAPIVAAGRKRAKRDVITSVAVRVGSSSLGSGSNDSCSRTTDVFVSYRSGRVARHHFAKGDSTLRRQIKDRTPAASPTAPAEETAKRGGAAEPSSQVTAAAAAAAAAAEGQPEAAAGAAAGAAAAESPNNNLGGWKAGTAAARHSAGHEDRQRLLCSQLKQCLDTAAAAARAEPGGGDDEDVRSQYDAAVRLLEEGQRRHPEHLRVFPNQLAFELFTKLAVLARGAIPAMDVLRRMRALRAQPSENVCLTLLAGLGQRAINAKEEVRRGRLAHARRRSSHVGTTAAGELQKRWVLRRVFDAIDADSSDSIEKAELLDALRKNDVIESLLALSPSLRWLCHVPRLHFNKVWDKIDASKDGSIDFDEWCEFSRQCPEGLHQSVAGAIHRSTTKAMTLAKQDPLPPRMRMAASVQQELDQLLNRAFDVVQAIKYSGRIPGRAVAHELIEVCVQCGEALRAEDVLRDMQRHGGRPGRKAFEAVLRGFRHEKQLKNALIVIQYMRSLRVPGFPLVYLILCEIAVQTDELGRGEELIQEMIEEGIFTRCEDALCALVRGFGVDGDLAAARRIAAKLDRETIRVALFEANVDCDDADGALAVLDEIGVPRPSSGTGGDEKQPGGGEDKPEEDPEVNPEVMDGALPEIHEAPISPHLKQCNKLLSLLAAASVKPASASSARSLKSCACRPKAGCWRALRPAFLAAVPRQARASKGRRWKTSKMKTDLYSVCPSSSSPS